jgi:murein DD-endopeptidase MepM/ murein hydrolase activator NlpD
MSTLNKSKQGIFVATIFALSSTASIFITAKKAEAIPLYPNGLSNNQVYRLQMEQAAPNGSPVTLNITPSYGQKNNGRFNTWMGVDNDSLFVYLTNGSGINFQNSAGRYYSINVPTLNISPGTSLNTYQSGFSRYQDWNIEKVSSSYNDTYLFHWRVDTNTNLCLDIGQGLRVNDQVPTLQYCNQNSASQRIRVINPNQVTNQYTTPSGNSLVNNNAMLPGTGIKSNNQCFNLNAQSDGNLVLYRKSTGQALWDSRTYGQNIKQTVFQNDGNLVIYNTSNQAVWASRTDGRGGKRLTVQDDGNFVMYNAQNQALWATNTVTPCNPPPPPTSPIQPVGNISNIPGNCHFGETCALNAPQKHTGVDYMNLAGTQVSATCAGTVKYAFTSNTGIWDRFTIIEHKNCGGYATLYGYYGHINPNVKVGDSVSRGQIIGSIADWPVNNSHLHFGLSTQLLLNGWGYQSGVISQKGWIDPLSFGSNSGWR